MYWHSYDIMLTYIYLLLYFPVHFSDDDDDIDEDELERLVAMTEEDLNPTPTESLTTTVKPCKRNYQQKDVCGKAEDRALSVAPPAPPESRPRTVPSVHLDVESMEEVDVPADPQST